MIEIHRDGEDSLWAWVRHDRKYPVNYSGSEGDKTTSATIVHLYPKPKMGGDPIASEVAACYHKDSFSKNIGKEIAIGRALAQLGLKLDHRYFRRKKKFKIVG